MMLLAFLDINTFTPPYPSFFKEGEREKKS